MATKQQNRKTLLMTNKTDNVSSQMTTFLPKWQFSSPMTIFNRVIILMHLLLFFSLKLQFNHQNQFLARKVKPHTLCRISDSKMNILSNQTLHSTCIYKCIRIGGIFLDFCFRNLVPECLFFMWLLACVYLLTDLCFILWDILRNFIK